ncbi:hypothetical protein Cantr_09733 [Candida viswanathii]|uniref:Uncharacterized protein n=1 Tax=Candida viswanathii TaxID=5486 RepID=A0A367YCJ6_9ASCO|nr:hypothetical protein Cantr_09733 [Candida viswanathii]
MTKDHLGTKLEVFRLNLVPMDISSLGRVVRHHDGRGLVCLVDYDGNIYGSMLVGRVEKSRRGGDAPLLEEVILHMPNDEARLAEEEKRPITAGRLLLCLR